MRQIIQPNASTLLIGAESNMQTTVAYEAVANALCAGATVCLLAETQGDINVFRSHITLWLRARERNPDHATRVFGLPDYRQARSAEELAPQILKACQGRHETNEAAQAKELVVFLDKASEMLATLPGDHRLGICADLADWLPNAAILVSAHHGPELVPAPPLATYRADQIYRVQSAGIAMNITVTPVKPPGDRIKLRGSVCSEGIVVIEEQEETHV